MHPAKVRSWLQTGGLPVEPIHRVLRDEFDQVHDVVYIGGACFRLRDRTGRQIGLVQFQNDAQNRLDEKVAETTARLASGEEKPVNVAAGDTLIRPLNMRDPADRALGERAVSGANANIIIPDGERSDPPPIDLPDYYPDYAEARDDDARKPGYYTRRLELAVLALALAAIVAAVVWSFAHA